MITQKSFSDLEYAAENKLTGRDRFFAKKVAAMGDAGYQGVEKREENLGKSVTWHVAMKRSTRMALLSYLHWVQGVKCSKHSAPTSGNRFT